MAIAIKNSDTHYGVVAWTLHWMSVAALLATIVVSSQFEGREVSKDDGTIMLHASVGIVLLALMVVRLTWRSINKNPVQSYRIHPAQKLAAKLVHLSIYLFLIVQCTLGLVILVAGARIIPFFQLSTFRTDAFKNVPLEQLAINIHAYTSDAVYPLIGLHISAAIYHQIFGTTH